MTRTKSVAPYNSLADTIQGILRRLDAEQHLQVYRLWLEWEQVVGAQIARRVRPLEFRNGVLLLVAASATWRQELEFLKPELLERIRTHLQDNRVRDLAITVGKLNASNFPVALHRRPGPRREISLDSADCEKTLQRVQDPTLAEALRRLWGARERFRLQSLSNREEAPRGKKR